jgi:hypothetical protein
MQYAADDNYKGYDPKVKNRATRDLSHGILCFNAQCSYDMLSMLPEELQ